MTYTVIWRYELIEADDPNEAVEIAASILEDAPVRDWQYEVINNDTGEVTKVELAVYDNEDAELEALTGVRMCY